MLLKIVFVFKCLSLYNVPSQCDTKLRYKGRVLIDCENYYIKYSCFNIISDCGGDNLQLNDSDKHCIGLASHSDIETIFL